MYLYKIYIRFISRFIRGLLLFSLIGVLFLKRREFLKYGLASFGGAFYSMPFLGFIFLNDVEQKKMPEKEGLIRVDLHTHVGNFYSKDELLNILSKGIIGISHKYSRNNPELTYEDALTLPGVTEIQNGFAKVEYKKRTGFIVRCQEFVEDNHVLGIGVRKYSNDPKNAFKALKLIRGNGGLVELVHPGLVPKWDDPLTLMGLITEKDYGKVEDLAYRSDAIEIFNSTLKNLLPNVWDFSKANGYAKNLVIKTGKSSLMGDDIHYLNDLIFTSGVYMQVPKSLEEMQYKIVNKKYILGPENSISRRNVLMGKAIEKLYEFDKNLFDIIVGNFSKIY